jgi:hypothetical protein
LLTDILCIPVAFIEDDDDAVFDVDDACDDDDDVVVVAACDVNLTAVNDDFMSAKIFLIFL